MCTSLHHVASFPDTNGWKLLAHSPTGGRSCKALTEEISFTMLNPVNRISHLAVVDSTSIASNSASVFQSSSRSLLSCLRNWDLRSSRIRLAFDQLMVEDTLLERDRERSPRILRWVKAS